MHTKGECNTEKTNSKETIWLKVLAVLIVAASAVAIGYSFAAFSKSVHTHTNNVYQEQLLQLAKRNAAGVTLELRGINNFVLAAADGFSQYENIHSPEAFAQLGKIQRNSPFNRMRLTLPDGTSIDNIGSIINISEREYFKKAMRGEASVSDQLESLYDKSDILVFCAPVKKDGAVVGTLHGVYSVSTMVHALNQFDFDGNGYTQIVDKAGSIIISTLPQNAELDMLQQQCKKMQIAPEDARRLLDIAAGYDTAQMSYVQNGQTYCVEYIPLYFQDWGLMQVMSQGVVTQYAKPIGTDALVLIVRISGVLLLVAGLLLWQGLADGQVRKANLQRIQNLTNNIPGGVVELEVHDDCVVRYASNGFFALTGYTKEQYMNPDGFAQGHLERIIVREDLPVFTAALQNAMKNNAPLCTEFRIKRQNGTQAWLSVNGTVLGYEAFVPVLQVICMDITDRRQTTDALLESAKLDKMTGIYNKVNTQEAICEVLRTDMPSVHNALLILDVDNFKLVNDRYGHQEGDRVLIALATLLRESFRATDIVGRMGGDEFMILMRNADDFAYVEDKVNHLLRKVQSIYIGNSENHLACSAGGIYFCTAQKTCYDMLYHEADEALYESKREGKNRFTLREIGS